MKWKKISLQEAIEQNVGDCFSDYEGKVNISSQEQLAVNDISIAELYVKIEDDYEKVPDTIKSIIGDIDLYRQNGYSYQPYQLYQPHQPSYQLLKKPYKISYGHIEPKGDYGRNIYCSHIQVPENNFNIDVWVCDETFEIKSIVRQSDINKGDKVFYKGTAGGVCEVVKVYEYPNRENLLIRLKRLFKLNPLCDDEFDVKWKDQNVCFVPYENKTNSTREIEFFNDSKNELDLLPWVIKDGHVVSIQWREIADAARYSVEMYRVIGDATKPTLYKLQSYDIERNICHLDLDNIIGKDIIFRVIAENRAGEIIAFSRGISEGQPQWW